MISGGFDGLLYEFWRNYVEVMGLEAGAVFITVEVSLFKVLRSLGLFLLYISLGSSLNKKAGMII